MSSLRRPAFILSAAMLGIPGTFATSVGKAGEIASIIPDARGNVSTAAAVPRSHPPRLSLVEVYRTSLAEGAAEAPLSAIANKDTDEELLNALGVLFDSGRRAAK